MSARGDRDEPADLLARVAAGEAAAFERCVDHWGGLVWSLCRRMLASHEEAEDATQEIFLELWRCAHRYDERLGSQTTFVGTLTRRRLIDRIRRRGRRPDVVPLDRPDGGVPVSPATADGPLIRSETVDAVMARFAQLRPERQRVLRLTLLDGLTHRETAERLDMPLGTVKCHARRGLLELRRMLADGAPAAGRAAAAAGQDTPVGNAAPLAARRWGNP